ncbi:DNA-directed RNA polymerase alpha subunit RpoA [Cyanobacterium sp. HL-69]|uniref:DNA-directed RNA polymerase subunit alpha n=1 Tax=unclassified Cyanobacterium TaxID=2629879 RepID=UPI00085280B7|nr:DNA-directed RNA polymerase subunit alpha [Cyanobacterium sp. IPPAS B-1200]AUC59871.1 DNA-directed RNA polymerase alpha subunit RpoA [Cyanobacterium sp. HL-69]OEJ79166.1 DNA-directed RNA polymerase subunit alpha [Cyanobacterium sp. IPPAS B-1200]
MAVFKIDCLENKTQKNQGQYGKFVLEPLERGQGITVGNSLRRVLLSNLEGAAVTAVRIAGVNHEFAVIDGVREDVLEIMLNMKELVFKSYSDTPQIGRLVATGPDTVTAAQFSLPSEIEIIEPNHYICTLGKGAKLEMEFKVEKGRGYRAIEKGNDENSSLDFLQIDSVFMPVSKVNFTVEEVRHEGKLADRLTLEIWTNGSMKPEEALSEAASILVGLFTPLEDVDNIRGKTEVQPVEEDPTSQIPIEELNLSVRAYNCLKRAQINTVADLLEYSQDDLLEIKNFGQKSAEEVIEALQQRLGITLAEGKAKDVAGDLIDSQEPVATP